MGNSGTPATCKAYGSRRLNFIAAVVCLSMLGAASAEAQLPQVSRTENQQQRSEFTDFNPCSMQPVAGEGNRHTQTTTKAGMPMEVTTRVHQNGQALAVDEFGAPIEPAARYQYQDWFTQTVRSSDPNFSFTTETRKHIVREGKRKGQLADSYFVWEEVTISTIPEENTFEQKRLECK